MVEVRHEIESPVIEDYVEAIRDEMRKSNIRGKVKPGWRIAITAGSRGIVYYPEILATVAAEVKKAGGEPFLIPTMGSHGGATPEGQVKVLKSLGITPETVGAPIISSMEVEEIGRLENDVPVYVDRNAMRSDGIIVVGRVKAHTDFKGKIESGLMKMMTIGLGKQKGAETVHWYRSEGYHKLIPATAKMIMKKAPIILGLAIVENAYHKIAKVMSIEPDDIEQEEIKLLEYSKDLLGRLPFKEIDVLIVEEIGKDISGTGMDTNVTGRFWLPGESDPRASEIKKIVVLDLSEETHGNAIGIGLADVTTKRAVSKIDYDATFVNCLTAGSTEGGRTPIFMPNDRDAIAMALRTCGPIDPRRAKVVRIKNTLELQRFWISDKLAEMVKSDTALLEKIRLQGEPREMQFDVIGTLAR